MKRLGRDGAEHEKAQAYPEAVAQARTDFADLHTAG